MSKTNLYIEELPIIEFDSDEWENNEEYEDVANEIIELIKENQDEYTLFLIRNNSYSFGDTESHPLIMINKGDYGGFSGTLALFIKDIVYDLIPYNEED